MIWVTTVPKALVSTNILALQVPTEPTELANATFPSASPVHQDTTALKHRVPPRLLQPAITPLFQDSHALKIFTSAHQVSTVQTLV